MPAPIPPAQADRAAIAMPVGVIVAALLGALVGLAADRLAARWPAHQVPGIRALDWRTAAVTLGSAAAFAGLAARWTEPPDLAVLGAWFAVLIVLLATDLDQRLLPDMLTLPLIPITLLVTLIGANPLLAGKELGLASAIAAGLGAPALLFITDRLFRGALGMGDLKLAVSLGLMSGVTRLFIGFLAASIAASVVLLTLMALRRLTLRSAIPFGPILICGAIIAALLS